MERERTSIVFSAKFSDFTEYNSSFDKGILRACYVGKNRNGSFISKATFERCIKSIYNCPLVCRYDRESDEIGAHDMSVIKKTDGSIHIANDTDPVGVIPESAKYWWEEIEEEDGTKHEYLCVDALLWKRQEAYQKIKADEITDESMEISIIEGSMVDGVYVIELFEFTAFCLLGTAEPCYESAAVLMFSQDEFQKKLDDMMREFKTEITMMQFSKEIDIQDEEKLKGGKEALEKNKRVLMEQYKLTEDMLDFSLSDFTEEDLREKFGAIVASKQKEDFELSSQRANEIRNAVEVEKVKTCYGETNRYWYMDHDDEVAEVYCYDTEDEWRLFGFKYSFAGDNVVIDFATKKRKKCAVADFDDGAEQAVFATVYSTITKQYSENETSWAEKYETAAKAIAELTKERDNLNRFKLEVESGEQKQVREDVISLFEDLEGIESFESLKTNALDYSVEDLEEKCFAIRGRNPVTKFSMSNVKTPILKVPKQETAKDPYGGVFEEYGIQ